MKNLKINISWLEELLPEGMMIPSSTMISGPGGTGKPPCRTSFCRCLAKSWRFYSRDAFAISVR
jgi:hypothetical protein